MGFRQGFLHKTSSTSPPPRIRQLRHLAKGRLCDVTMTIHLPEEVRVTMRAFACRIVQSASASVAGSIHTTPSHSENDDVLLTTVLTRYRTHCHKGCDSAGFFQLSRMVSMSLANQVAIFSEVSPCRNRFYPGVTLGDAGFCSTSASTATQQHIYDWQTLRRQIILRERAYFLMCECIGVGRCSQRIVLGAPSPYQPELPSGF